jgi:hypothetical protein
MKAELDRIEAEAALLKAAGDEWDAERQQNRAAALWTSIRRTVPTSCAGMIGQLEILPGLDDDPGNLDVLIAGLETSGAWGRHRCPPMMLKSFLSFGNGSQPSARPQQLLAAAESATPKKIPSLFERVIAFTISCVRSPTSRRLDRRGSWRRRTCTSTSRPAERTKRARAARAVRGRRRHAKINH